MTPGWRYADCVANRVAVCLSGGDMEKYARLNRAEIEKDKLRRGF